MPSVDLDVVARRAGARAAVSQALQRLVQAARVIRVRRDLLVLPDATGLLSVDIVDLVEAVAPRPYLITAGAALEHADLTDQYSFGLVVLVPSAVTKLRVRRYSAGSRTHSSRSSARRVGLIVERLFGADVAAPYRDLIGSNRAPTMLRPGGSSVGPVDSTWRVVVNAVLEPETVS